MLVRKRCGQDLVYDEPTCPHRFPKVTAAAMIVSRTRPWPRVRKLTILKLLLRNFWWFFVKNTQPLLGAVKSHLGCTQPYSQRICQLLE
jgi:hypothetical protein